MTPAERMQSLSNRPPEVLKQMLAKVREYQSLRPDQRELRLRATELRWYLMPLLQGPAADRTARLQLVPEENRKMIEDRLEKWDKLPPGDQQQLLTNVATILYFTQPSDSTSRPSDTVSPQRREKLEAGVRLWQQLSEEQRRQIEGRFDEFFVLTPPEQEKALRTLSEAERQQIENTLRQFARLSPSQRATCIQSFEKFTNLSLKERKEFLDKAERWKMMKPTDRQAWRELVNRFVLLPPSPWEAGMPPLPPKLAPRRPTATFATNEAGG